MEQEEDFFHLFTQHQFIIFVVVSLLILALLFAVAYLLGRRAGRRKMHGGSNEPRRR